MCFHAGFDCSASLPYQSSNGNQSSLVSVATSQNSPNCIKQTAPLGAEVTPVESHATLRTRSTLLSALARWGEAAQQVLGQWLLLEFPCAAPQWPHVLCSTSGQVVGLNLTGAGLSGPLPEDLVQLPGLEILDLSNNSLSGPLPSKFSNSLKLLDLSRNQLLGAWTSYGPWGGSLKYLNLSGNLNMVSAECLDSDPEC